MPGIKKALEDDLLNQMNTKVNSIILIFTDQEPDAQDRDEGYQGHQNADWQAWD